MKQALHVCTVASHHTRRLTQLLESCKRQGISLDILGMGKPFRGFTEKIIQVQEYLETLPDSDVVMFVDAYDVLILATGEHILDAFLSMNAPFIVSGEKICFPDKELACKYPKSPTPFAYINSGGYIGYVGYIKQLFKDFPSFKAEDDDQRLVTTNYLEHPDKYCIDYHCQIFLTTYDMRYDELDIDKKRGAVHNVVTHTTPCVIHGNSKSLWYQYIYNRLFPKEYAQQGTTSAIKNEDKRVLLAIQARDIDKILPRYLQSIDALDYKKKLITVYVNTCGSSDQTKEQLLSGSSDQTKELLLTWCKEHENQYERIIFDTEEVNAESFVNPYVWTPQRYMIPGSIRNKSVQVARELGVEYYFCVDCDNFIAPYTLKALINKDKPIVAPMLCVMPQSDAAINKYSISNYCCAVTEEGYYKDHPDYVKIATYEQIGTFKVPLVFGTYLIQSNYLDKLTFVDETRNYPYIVFSRSAREHGVEQYICNEYDFGVMIHFSNFLTDEQASVLQAFLQE